MSTPLSHTDSNSSLKAMIPSPHHSTSARTPSPTPSEQAALSGKKFRGRDLFKRKNWKLLAIVVVVTTLIVLLIVYQDNIVRALRPVARWMHDTKGGWLIPIAILMILSFPPLFGHEIVVALIGFTWGLGVGFGITVAGTYIGEALTYYIFKYTLKSRTERWETTSIRYGTLARVIREGEIPMAIIARYSTIPGHILTALFACCGMGIGTFTIAVFAALPRQLVAVYFGYALASADSNGHEPKSKTIIKWVSIAVITLVTIIAMKYIEYQEDAVRPDIVYQRRKRRQGNSQASADAGILEQGGDAHNESDERKPGLAAPVPSRAGLYPPPSILTTVEHAPTSS